MWWQLIFIVLISISSCQSERHRSTRQESESGNGWDIRLAVPGEPGNDYPTHRTIPRTSFSCAGRSPGYYADLETNCQVFRICTLGSTYGFQSFLCPNGTLFNQAVFVCDWWMNVNCDNSQQFFDNNNDKFGNLRLGPELMNDVKKMIMHPMRNPYDRRTMKSNLIVMQEYIPPSSQLFPGTQLQAPRQTSENVFLPAKLQQHPTTSSIKGNLVSASTPNPQYVPANRNQRPQNDAEVFQRQKQTGQYNIQSNQIRNNQVQSGKYVHRPHHTEVNNGPYTQKYTQSGQYNSGQYSQKYQGGQYQQYNGNKFNGQTQQPVKQNIVANSLSGRLVQQQNNGYIKNIGTIQQTAPQQNYRQSAQLRQPVNTQTTQTYNPQSGIIRQNAQYTDGSQPSLANQKQTEFGISYSKQPINANLVLSQQKQPYSYDAPQLQFSNQITGEVGNEAKQNLVSNNNKPTVIAKTVTFNRIIQEPRSGGPKSRITFKTWIIKPGKSAKLIAESGPYSYNRPANPTNFERLVVEPTPYYYNSPATPAKLIQNDGYVYNRPTVAAKLQVSNNGYDYSKPTVLAKQVEQGYSYNKPTVAAKQVEQLGYVYNKPTMSAKQVVQTGYVYNRPTPPPTQASRLYLAPISTTRSSRLYLGPTPSPTVASRLYLVPTTARPTLSSRLYIPPTTYKPLARLYIPASKEPLVVSNQYSFPQNNLRSEKLQASPSAPTPVVALPDDKPSFTLTKHSHINTNHNNLTFTDILTKEKLDITVNHIVKDTSQILGTAEPQPFGKLRQAEEPDETYLPPESRTESTESISSQDNGELKSSRIIQQPTSDLLPPEEEFVQINENNNKLATLPFFKEPHPTNTIERTVSLKISIPEKTAEYLFKACNDSNYNRLEILNTGSSNYLVLSNKLNKDSTHSFIPLGKLITDNISNLSDSQALVFSFLADSINQAKDYHNIAQQVTNTQTEFPSVGNEELARISNEISQLTSSQYTGNQYNVNQNQVAQISNQGNQYSTSAKYTQPEIQHAQINLAPVSQQNFKSAQYNNAQNNQYNNQVPSGQLYQAPVPEVSNIYNEPNSAKYVNTEQVQQHSEVGDLQNGIHEETNKQHVDKQNSDEVEVIHTQNSPASAPAKLQAAPTDQPDFHTQEDQAQTILDNLSKSGNGISAQLRDKIVGTISHPLQENKLVTYKKDQSYYVYTNLEQANNGLGQFNNAEQSAKLTQANNNGNSVSFQFIPSFSYQLEDEKEQQKLLNAFHIDEYGSPKGVIGNHLNQNVNSILTSNVDYTVQHPGQINSPQTLYSGPSSYSAPQGSVGTLEHGKAAKLEQFEPNSETDKSTPAPQFRGY